MQTMGDSLFNIFGNHITGTGQAVKNVLRQPLSNDENMLNKVSTGPIKPNEPIKPTFKKSDDVKKSFLLNDGKKGLALQMTPLRQALTPRAVNLGSMIYNDVVERNCKEVCTEEIEFTKPSYAFDNYHRDILDLLETERDIPISSSPTKTPPPSIPRISMEFGCSPCQDKFFSDDLSITAFSDDEDIFPDLYSDDE